MCELSVRSTNTTEHLTAPGMSCSLSRLSVAVEAEGGSQAEHLHLLLLLQGCAQ